MQEQGNYRQSGGSARTSVLNQLLRFDMYRQPFLFLMPDHEPSYRSCVGTVLSILTLILVTSYSTYKFIDLIELN